MSSERVTYNSRVYVVGKACPRSGSTTIPECSITAPRTFFVEKWQHVPDISIRSITTLLNAIKAIACSDATPPG